MKALLPENLHPLAASILVDVGVLATRRHTGQVTDPGSGLARDVLDSLFAVPETVWLRVID